MGIYKTMAAAGEYTCAGYPASLGYEDIDAADFASWGVDCKYLIFSSTFAEADLLTLSSSEIVRWHLKSMHAYLSQNVCFG